MLEQAFATSVSAGPGSPFTWPMVLKDSRAPGPMIMAQGVFLLGDSSLAFTWTNMNLFKVEVPSSYSSLYPCSPERWDNPPCLQQSVKAKHLGEGPTRIQMDDCQRLVELATVDGHTARLASTSSSPQSS